MSSAFLRTSWPIVWALLAVACSQSSTPANPDSGPPAPRDAGGMRDSGGPAADAPAPIPDAGPDSPPPPRPDGAMAAADYGAPGPFTFTMREDTVMTGGASVRVTTFLPEGEGPFPVIVFACGSQQTAAGYLVYGERVASHGMAMVIADDAGVFTNTADIVPRFVHVAETWIPATFGDTIDVERMGIAGHSRGGAVSLLAAEHDLADRGDGWFGVDPVDNQFLMAPREYARTDLPTIGMPTVFLGAEVESNCSPRADSYPTLAPLAPEPTVLIVGVGAGHTQMEDPTGCTGCGVCTPDGTADPAVVLAYSIRYFTAFFARVLLGDEAVGPDFEGAGAPADIAAGLIRIE